MKKDELLVLGLAGVAVLLIVKAGGVKLPTLTAAKAPARTGSQWEAGGIMIDNNAKWSSSGRAWYDPWTAMIDGGFTPNGL